MGPRVVQLLLPLLALAPNTASAIDPTLCADDGVTDVPRWVTGSGPTAGRDRNECLNIDPGNGEAPIPFQYEHLDKAGVAGCGNPDDPGVERIDHKAGEFGECRTKGDGELCTILFWNVEIDNYLDTACKNSDILFYGSGIGFQYWYFKDSKIINGWKCSGGAWDGPNGLSCAAGEDSNAHADGIQARGGQLSGGGWMIFQDSYLANAGNALGRFTNPTSYPPQGSFLFQGLKTGIFSTPLGMAENWQQDCRDRGTNDTYCTTNKNIINYGGVDGIDELWFVDVSGGGHGGAQFQIKNNVRKVVIVNTGCGSDGCDGTVEYVNGWPWPVDGNDGPGSCPNGLVLQDPTGNGVSADATYCYDSLESARDDAPTETANEGDCPDCPHKMPPFVHLSASGWANPPGGPGDDGDSGSGGNDSDSGTDGGSGGGAADSGADTGSASATSAPAAEDGGGDSGCACAAPDRRDTGRGLALAMLLLGLRRRRIGAGSRSSVHVAADAAAEVRVAANQIAR